MKKTLICLGIFVLGFTVPILSHTLLSNMVKKEVEKVVSTHGTVEELKAVEEHKIEIKDNHYAIIRVDQKGFLTISFPIESYRYIAKNLREARSLLKEIDKQY